jgi:hypothetical protein
VPLSVGMLGLEFVLSVGKQIPVANVSLQSSGQGGDCRENETIRTTRALQTEIQKPSLSTFMSEEHKIVQTDCWTSQKHFGSWNSSSGTYQQGPYQVDGDQDAPVPTLCEIEQCSQGCEPDNEGNQLLSSSASSSVVSMSSALLLAESSS